MMAAYPSYPFGSSEVENLAMPGFSTGSKRTAVAL